MLNSLIPYIDQHFSEFNKQYGLAELLTEVKEETPKTFPAIYTSGDDYAQIDLEKGVSYHRLDGAMNVVQTDDNTIGCARGLDITYPMVLICCIDRLADCDQYSLDALSNNIAFRLQQIKFTKAQRSLIKAWSLEINLRSINTRRSEVWNQEYTNVPMQANFDYAYFSISYEIAIKADSSCLDILNCGASQPPITQFNCKQIASIPLNQLNCLTQDQIDFIISGNMQPIPVTYEQLSILLNESQLKPGREYEITDYQTKWRINGTSEIGEGQITPLVVKAISSDEISGKAYQPTYPFDEIDYNFYNNLCEDGTTPRTGMITMRKSTLIDVSVGYDWREVMYYRYGVSTTSHAAWSSLTTYARHALVIYNDILWTSSTASNLNNTPGSNNYWCKVLADVSTSYQLYALTNSFSQFTIIGDPDRKKLCYTFHNNADDSLSTNVRTTHIGKLDVFNFGSNAIAPYNNIVIQVPNNNSNVFIGDNIFDTDCWNMNFYSPLSFLSNNFGPTIGEFLGRSMTACVFWSRSNKVISGINALRFIGGFTQWVSGDNVNTINSQFNSGCRFIGSSANINIFGLVQNSVFGSSSNRIFMERPTGEIMILGATNTNQGAHIGDHAGNYTIITGRLESTGTTIDLMITKTFTGLSGAGAVGTVTLDDIMPVPNGYRIDEINSRSSGLVFGAGANLNLGFTGSATVGLDNTTGALTVLSSSATVKASPTAGPSTSNTNVIIMSVNGNSITAGTIVFYIKLIRTIIT